MAQISSLHELAQGGLRELASRRVMPYGFDRSLSRRAELMTRQLGEVLPGLLAAVPDTLMARPAHQRWQEFITLAVQERLLKVMVVRWVALLQAEPKPDQMAACALATAREQIGGAGRLLSRLEDVMKNLEEAQAIVTSCSFEEAMELSDAREAVAKLLVQTKRLQKNLDRYEGNLEEEIVS